MLDVLIEVSNGLQWPFGVAVVIGAVLTVLGILLCWLTPRCRCFMPIYWGLLCLLVAITGGPTAERFWTLVRKDVDMIRFFDDDLFAEQAGEQVLSPVVREVLSIVRRRGLVGYGISRGLAADNYTTQRITESVWPARREQNAEFIFYLVGELTDTMDGEVLERGEEVALVYCPAGF